MLLYSLVNQNWVMELHYNRQVFPDLPGPMDLGLTIYERFSLSFSAATQ